MKKLASNTYIDSLREPRLHRGVLITGPNLNLCKQAICCIIFYRVRRMSHMRD